MIGACATSLQMEEAKPCVQEQITLANKQALTTLVTTRGVMTSACRIVQRGYDLLSRTITASKWCPLRGTLRFFETTEEQERSYIAPHEIPGDTTVLLIKKDHAAIIMGGYQLSAQDDIEDIQSYQGNHVFSWCPVETVPAKASRNLRNLFPQKEHHHSNDTDACRPAEYQNKNKSLKKFLQSLLTVEGYNRVKTESRIKAIPVNGLDTRAMREKAREIKETKQFCWVEQNCSQTVLSIIKAGLPIEQAQKVCSPWLWTTPADIENITEKLIEEKILTKGEVDIWFDAREQ